MRNKCEKVAQDPSKMTVSQNHDGIREASSEGRSPSQGGLVREFGRKVRVVIIQHAGGSGTPAHWDAPRGFARQRGGPDIKSFSELSDDVLVRIGHTNPEKDFFRVAFAFGFSKSIQIPSKPSENFPKTFPEPSKIHPKSTQKAFWTPSWPHARKKLNSEEQKIDQKPAKSAQRTPQSAPTPSQVEPKTFPNPVLKPSCGCFFATQNLH